MATITKGILGGFSGKVGTVVGANYRGKDIIRSRPKASGKAPTVKQLLQQAKFKLVVSFLQPLKVIQNKYFGMKMGAKSRVNLAAAYLLDNAIQVIANTPELMYNKILITKGELAAFQNALASAKPGGVVDLSWEDNSTQANANGTDVVNAVCYCEALDMFSLFPAVATRIDLVGSINLPGSFTAQQVQIWLYMNNAAQSSACNSDYLGAITIQ